MQSGLFTVTPNGDGEPTTIHFEFIDKACRPWNARRGAWILNLTRRGIYPGAPMFHFVLRPAFVVSALLFTSTIASAGFEPDMAGEPYRLHYGADATLRSLCAAEAGKYRAAIEDLPLCRDRLLNIIVDFGELGYAGDLFCFPRESPPGSIAEAIVNYLAVNSPEWPTPAFNASLDALRRKYACR
jgi:hypothetical protein